MKIELVVGDWVLYESIRYDDEDDDVIWLGIVMSKPKWGGQCAWENDTGRRIEIYEVSLVANEVAINIMWYERIDLNGEELEYHVAQTDTNSVVQ